jgi:hypothetical protein
MVRRWQERPAYRLRIDSRVRDDRRRAVRDFLGWYRRRHPARHRIPIQVVAERRLTHPSVPRPAHGLFWYPSFPRCSIYSPKIWIAGGLGHRWRIVHTLAHELAHYREWARTGASTERGKDRAADALLRAYGRETGRSFL